MVVARVFILLVFDMQVIRIFFILFFIYLGLFIGWHRVIKTDFKRVIAYSTSSQLILIAIFSVWGLSYLGLLYVFVHRIFKALIFFFVGLIVHSVSNQHLLFNIINNSFVLVIILMFLNIGGWLFFSVRGCKDIILLSFILYGLYFILYAYSTFLYELNFFKIGNYTISLSWPIKYLIISSFFVVFWLITNIYRPSNGLLLLILFFIFLKVVMVFILAPFKSNRGLELFVFTYWKGVTRKYYNFSWKSLVQNYKGYGETSLILIILYFFIITF